MARSSLANCKTWLARLVRVFVSTAACIPLLAVGQTDLPDLTHKLTAYEKRAVAPDFQLKDLDGKTHRLSSYKGKVVLVNFWATWCPPCRREMPSMERLYQKLQGAPFTILAIDQIEGFDLVFAFTGELSPSPTFPILLDGKGEVSKQWRVPGLPSSYIIDKQGRIVYRAVGGREFDHPQIEKIFRELINE